MRMTLIWAIVCCGFCLQNIFTILEYQRFNKKIKRLNEYQNSGNTMNRIIRINFVVIAILSTVRSKCKQRLPMNLNRVCGSDGKTYSNQYRLEEYD